MHKLAKKVVTLSLSGAMGMVGALAVSTASIAAEVKQAKFNDAGEVIRPEGYREWVFVGAPLTPHALNGGNAPFPEYHNVYIEPSAYEHWKKTGEFAEGTQLAKELTLIYSNDNDEKTGASSEVSGVGYQQGEFSGLELTVKDSKRFPDMAGGWAYFSFGHKAPPYAETAKAFPAESCNACHEASAADDFVFTQFYPVLRAAKGSEK